MKIVSEVNHPLLKRKHVVFEIDHSGNKTPKKDELLQKIAEITKSSHELIRIKYIASVYGATKARITANIYRDENALRHIELIKKKTKKKEDGKKEASKKQES
ncbi:hypothetical protein HY500_04385 [Candidatus Woesearchaeota archaeon]|nr:hypothetical protein [Candidatus Woesearchaeota archaeon]